MEERNMVKQNDKDVGGTTTQTGDIDLKSLKPKLPSRMDLFRIKIEFNDSTTSFNRNIACEFESSQEDVKTLLNYAHDFIEEQKREKRN
jgi:hypothetical protein